ELVVGAARRGRELVLLPALADLVVDVLDLLGAAALADDHVHDLGRFVDDLAVLVAGLLILVLVFVLVGLLIRGRFLAGPLGGRERFAVAEQNAKEQQPGGHAERPPPPRSTHRCVGHRLFSLEAGLVWAGWFGSLAGVRRNPLPLSILEDVFGGC